MTISGQPRSRRSKAMTGLWNPTGLWSAITGRSFFSASLQSRCSWWARALTASGTHCSARRKPGPNKVVLAVEIASIDPVP
jgi:hypothetical protein